MVGTGSYELLLDSAEMPTKVYFSLQTILISERLCSKILAGCSLLGLCKIKPPGELNPIILLLAFELTTCRFICNISFNCVLHLLIRFLYIYNSAFYIICSIATLC